jgi:hypothetical protein
MAWKTLFVASQRGGRGVAAVQRDGGGGATVGFSYRILVYRDGRHAEHGEGGRRVWRSYEVAPVAVDWSGDTMRVMVGRARENTERLHTVQSHGGKHLAVLTEVCKTDGGLAW